MPEYVNVRRIMLGHKRAAKSPLLNKFVEKCLHKEYQHFVSSRDLFLGYKCAVELWTDGDNQAKILIKEKAFQRQFKKRIAEIAMIKKWTVKSSVQAGRRGYEGFQLTRPPRQPPFRLEGPRVATTIGNFAANPVRDPPIELHEVPTDPRNAGICAFAIRDIERGEVVVEYTGELITAERANTRERAYEAEERMCTLMFLESRGEQVAIDPYGEDKDDMTWGATINHSQNNANLRPVVHNRNSSNPRVFFVAIVDIPQMTELLWNYSDPHWEFQAHSQTLL